MTNKPPPEQNSAEKILISNELVNMSFHTNNYYATSVSLFHLKPPLSPYKKCIRKLKRLGAIYEERSEQ